MMYEQLEEALKTALTVLENARKPCPVPLAMSLPDMAREAEKIGGDGSHIELECRLVLGAPVYCFKVWDSAIKHYARGANQRQVLEEFARECAPPIAKAGPMTDTEMNVVLEIKPAAWEPGEREPRIE